MLPPVILRFVASAVGVITISFTESTMPEIVKVPELKAKAALAKVIIKNAGHLKEILGEDIFLEIIKRFSGYGFVIDLE